MAHFQPDLAFAGILANKLGSARHAEILRDSLPADIRWFGGLPRSPDIALPSRHLGLVQADELADLDARLNAAAAPSGSHSGCVPRSLTFGGDASNRAMRQYGAGPLPVGHH